MGRWQHPGRKPWERLYRDRYKSSGRDGVPARLSASAAGGQAADN